MGRVLPDIARQRQTTVCPRTHGTRSGGGRWERRGKGGGGREKGKPSVGDDSPAVLLADTAVCELPIKNESWEAHFQCVDEQKRTGYASTQAWTHGTGTIKH